MKHSTLLLLVYFIFASNTLNHSYADEDVLKYVNPFIGTGGVGYGIGSTPPGPQVPFGAMRLSPDTINWENFFIPFDHFGGYYYDDTIIRTFSHTHMVGSGALDYGNIGVMPVKVSLSDLGKDKFLLNYNYKSHFSHDREHAEPGYYSVDLDRYNIKVELTATKFVGVHRYTFPTDSTPDQRFVLFDLAHSLDPKSIIASNISISDSAITGFVRNSGSLSKRFGGVNIYLSAMFDSKFTKFGTWDGNANIYQNATFANGTTIGAYFGGFTSPTVTLYLAISFVSVEQANLNLKQQLCAKFDDIKQSAQAEWRSELSRIKISPATSRDNLVKFYTAYYHAILTPTLFSDPNGLYLGFDNKIHTLNQNQNGFYSDMSIWDVHRTQMPFLSLMYPDRMSDIVRSLIQMVEQGGYLPRWPMANGYTNCMLGTHATVIITDAFLKKVGKFTDREIAIAYDGMIRAATKTQPHASRSNVEDYIRLGYVPFEKEHKSATHTVEYAYDDYILGLFIDKIIGNSTEAKVFMDRGKNYRNVFNKESQFICPKTTDGKWHCPWGPEYLNVFDSRYVEGDAWHYRFFAPHDTMGLIETFESKQTFLQQLDKFLYWSTFDPTNALPNPYYWAGNEHDLFSPWMFNYAGSANLTQKYTRWIMDNKYLTGPNGLPGNDDYGTMSSWFIFAAIGFYPVAGTTTYVVGSPLFDQITLQLSKDCTLIVNAPCASGARDEKCIYVKSLKIDGDQQQTLFLDHSQLVCAQGKHIVTLDFVMDRVSQ
jgi:predicted alpha-1,2-mannosidase